MVTERKEKTMENINELFRRRDAYRIGYLDGTLATMTAIGSEKDLETDPDPAPEAKPSKKQPA